MDDFTLIEIILGILGSAIAASQTWVMKQIHHINVALAAKHAEYDLRIRSIEENRTVSEERIRQIELSRIQQP